MYDSPTTYESYLLRSKQKELTQKRLELEELEDTIYHTPKRRVLSPRVSARKSRVELYDRVERTLRYHTPTKSKISTIRKPKRRYSPLRVKEEVILVKGLMGTMNLNRDVENARCELSVRSDFNLLDAFR